MNIFDQLLADNQIPKFVRVRHEMDHSHIDDIEGPLPQAMRREARSTASSPATVSALPRAAVMCEHRPAIRAIMRSGQDPRAHAGAKAEGHGYGVRWALRSAPPMDTW